MLSETHSCSIHTNRRPGCGPELSKLGMNQITREMAVHLCKYIAEGKGRRKEEEKEGRKGRREGGRKEGRKYNDIRARNNSFGK